MDPVQITSVDGYQLPLIFSPNKGQPSFQRFVNNLLLMRRSLVQVQLDDQKLETFRTLSDRWCRAPDTCRLAYVSHAVVQFIYQIGCMENMDEISLALIQELVHENLKPLSDGSGVELNETRRPILNLIEAMNMLNEDCQYNGNIVHAQSVLEAHGILMKHRSRIAGVVRKNSVETKLSLQAMDSQGGVHYYPPHEVTETGMYAIFDTYCEYVLQHEPSTVEEYVKLAAWLMFMLVDLHPFEDGNGRLCHLMANRIIRAIVPFPVSVFPTAPTVKEARRIYVRAIEAARKGEACNVTELANLLLDSMVRAYADALEFTVVGQCLEV